MVSSKRADSLARRSCQRVRSNILSYCKKICFTILLVLVFTFGISASALGDPPITPPTDPSAIPVLPSEFTTAQPALQQLKLAALKDTKRQIRLYQKSAWRWQRMMGMHRTPASRLSLHTRSIAYAQWSLKKWKTISSRSHIKAKHWMALRISYFKQNIAHWTLVMGKKPSGFTAPSGRQLASAAGVEGQFNRWRNAYADVMENAYSPPLMSQFLCIHRYEGAWNANTGNGYYGGLQMDLRFQSLYGSYLLKTKGTADNWTDIEQIWVAVKAYRSGRGFYPWPNTARACGLI